jgi:AdoMet-dependent rRNA methyltransferase SPB1
LTSLCFLQIQKLEAQAAAEKKKDRKRSNEKKSKQQTRMKLGMMSHMDVGYDQDNLDLGGFEVGGVPNDVDADQVDEESEKEMVWGEKVGDEEDDRSEDEKRLDNMEQELDNLYDHFQEKRLEKDLKGKIEKRKKERLKRNFEEGGEEWGGIKQSGSEQESSEEDEEEMKELELDMKNWNKPRLPLDEDVDESEEEQNQKRGKKRKREELDESAKKRSQVKSNAEKMWYDQEVFKDLEKLGIAELIEEDDQNEDLDRESDEEEEQVGYLTSSMLRLNDACSVRRKVMASNLLTMMDQTNGCRLRMNLKMSSQNSKRYR